MGGYRYSVWGCASLGRRDAERKKAQVGFHFGKMLRTRSLIVQSVVSSLCKHIFGSVCISIDCHSCALSHCLQEDDRKGIAPSANKL